MTAPAKIYPTLQVKSKLAVMRVKKIPLSFYRYLYNEVGKEHYWFARKSMGDDALSQIVHAKTVQIYVLYYDGAPAGFGELDCAKMPDSIELVYFGLCPQFIGRGLGKWFLGQLIRASWEDQPGKLIVSTVTLDHPNALPLYQKLGFSPVDFKEELLQDWLQHKD